MHYEQFTKKLATPAGFRAPERLLFDHFDARAISRADLTEDVRGINSSLELILRTRGGGWPTEPVTATVDFVDLVWHELEFRDGYSFTYPPALAGHRVLILAPVLLKSGNPSLSCRAPLERRAGRSLRQRLAIGIAKPRLVVATVAASPVCSSESVGVWRLRSWPSAIAGRMSAFRAYQGSVRHSP